MREVSGPLRHKRSLPLATERDEGEDVRAFCLLALDFGPGVVETLEFVCAAFEFLWGILEG